MSEVFTNHHFLFQTLICHYLFPKKKTKVHEILDLLEVRSIEIPTLERTDGDRRRLKDVAGVFTYSTFEVLIWGGRLPHKIYITIIKFFSLFYCVTCH